MVVAYVSYEFARHLSESDPSLAMHNANTVIGVETLGGINVEHAVQQAVLANPLLITAANYFYGSAYIVATVATLVWLYRRRPSAYRRWMTTLMVITYVCLVGFMVFPLMPPRLLDRYGATTGFLDTVNAFPTFWSVTTSTAPTLTNQFAAMPSVHCAWACWVGAAVWSEAGAGRARAFALAFPTATMIVVLATANHYVLDLVVAGVITVSVTALMARLTRWTPGGAAARS